MNAFVRQKTYELGDSFKDVEIFTRTGLQQTAAQNQRRKRTKESTPEQKNLNDERSKKHYMRLVKKYFKPGDIHLTLSYADEELPATEDESNRNVRNFIRRVNYALRKIGKRPLRYIAVTSVHGADGSPARIHHHIILSGVDDRDKLESLWRFGYANADRIKNFRNTMNKLAGYISKQTSGRKRWFASKHLDIYSYSVDGVYSVRGLRRVAEYEAYLPDYWARKFPGWEIVDKDHDIKVTLTEFGVKISLQLTKKGVNS